MADEILVKYKADLAEFDARLSASEAKIRSIESSGKKAFKGIEDQAKTSGNAITNALSGIAEGVAAAFAIDKIVRFAEESVKAANAAQSAISSLNFSVTKILGGTKEQVDQLIKQSEKLSKTTYFSPRQIQEAQNLQTQFGLSVSQTEKLTDLIPDLAVALGTDLKGATDTALRAIEGQSKGLEKIGANFKNTGSQVGNYNKLIDNLSKLQGTATDALNTNSGAAKNNEKQLEILQERIGARLSPALNTIKLKLLEIADVFAKGLFPDSARAQLESQVNDLRDKLSGVAGKLTSDQIKAEADKISNQIKQLKQDAANLPFNLDRGDALESIGKQVSFLTTKELALREIVLQRRADEKKAAEDAVHNADIEKLAKEDLSKLSIAQLNAEITKLKERNDAATIDVKDQVTRREEQIDELNKAAQKAADDEKKRHEDFWKDLKKDVDNYEASQNEILDKMSDSIDDQIKEQDKLAQKKKNDIAQELKDEQDARDQINKIAEDAFNKEQKRQEELKKQREELIEIALKGIDLIFENEAKNNEELLADLDKRKETSLTSFDEEGTALEKRNERGAISDREYAKQKEAIEKKKREADKKFLDEENRIKNQQAQAEWRRQIFDAISSGALAVIKAYPNIPLAVAVGALATLQTAIIVSHPPPKLEKGTSYVKLNGNKPGKDTVLAFLDEGERVVSKNKNKKNWEIYEALDNNKFHELVNRKYVAPRIIDFQKEVERRRVIEQSSQLSGAMLSAFSGLDEQQMRKIFSKGVTINNWEDLVNIMSRQQGFQAGKFGRMGS